MSEDRKKIHIKAGKFPKGHVFFQQGDSLDKNAYMLNSGKIGVYIDGFEVAILKTPGVFFGEMAALSNAPRKATCLCLVESSVTTIPQSAIKKVMVQHPKIALSLLKTFANRLKVTTNKYLDAQQQFINTKKELYKQKGLPPKNAEYDLLTDILEEMGYVSKDMIENAKNTQEELATKGKSKAISAILSEKGFVGMHDMIECMKLMRALKNEN